MYEKNEKGKTLMPAQNKSKFKTKDITLVSMFTAVLAVCSWISIPWTVPLTLQTFGVFLTVSVLGGKRGTVSVLAYLLLGMVGVPVFSGFSGGIGCLFGSTGGYIIGFLFTALTMWGMEVLFGRKSFALVLSMILGLLACYFFGTAMFVTVYSINEGSIGVWTALTLCVFPYIIPDLIKIALAFFISKKLRSAKLFSHIEK